MKNGAVLLLKYSQQPCVTSLLSTAVFTWYMRTNVAVKTYKKTKGNYLYTVSI